MGYENVFIVRCYKQEIFKLTSSSGNCTKKVNSKAYLRTYALQALAHAPSNTEDVRRWVVLRAIANEVYRTAGAQEPKPTTTNMFCCPITSRMTAFVLIPSRVHY